LDTSSEPVDLADHMGAAVGRIDDHDVVVARGPQRHRLCRECLIGPVITALRLVQDPVLVEVAQHPEGVLGPEALRSVERQLERGALEVLDQHVQVVRVHQAGLGRAAEHELGVLDDVLIGRGARRDDERDREVLAAPGTADLLPGGRDRAGVAHEHRRLEGADVDAELQRVRRHDAAHRAVAQPALDGAALRRQVAAPVPADELGRPLRLRESRAQVREQELGLHA
jgi:hypothetical protein